MIYISLGSNLGNRLQHIQQALKQLQKNNFKIIQKSPVIETKALLHENAPKSWNKPFLNMVIAGTTKSSPETLLQTLQDIEKILGRDKVHERWAPRVIDLDILLMDDKRINTAKLTIPHPELLNRDFLIHLLAMVAPNEYHPIARKNYAEIAYEKTDIADCFIKSIVASPALVGVVNITPDSFSDGGKFFDPEAAIEHVLQLHEAGASIIELGAQSTKPQAALISAEVEYERLHPILEKLSPYLDEKKIALGIDSFFEENILKIIKQYPISWVNDVKTAMSKKALCEIAASHCQYVAMHSLSIPPDQQKIIAFNKTPIHTVARWAKATISQLLQCGFSHEQIILDPGIGFNKTPYQSLALLASIKQLTKLNINICIGHSRKSFLNIFNYYKPEERDIESIAISDYLASSGIDYLRVHNVEDHQRFFVGKLLENKMLLIKNRR